MKNAQLENLSNIILGGWLIISTWVLTGTSTNLTALANWNGFIVGCAFIVIATAAMQKLKPWEEWISLCLGLWLVVSPWALGFYSETGLVWNAVIVGLLSIVASGSALAEARRIQRPLM